MDDIRPDAPPPSPTSPAPPRAERAHTGRLIAGLAILFAGVVFTLGNFGVRVPDEIWQLVPAVVFAALATSRLLRLGVFDPLVLIFGGLAAYFTLRAFDLDYYFPIRKLWPLILVVIGIRMVTARSRARRALRAGSSQDLDEFVAFGGIKRVVTRSDFTGGALSAFCGGFEVDLRRAQMAGNEATIDVFVMWGGGEIFVPQDWQVVVRALPLFGGSDDKTAHASGEAGSPAKTLVITGTILMGGIEIKN